MSLAYNLVSMWSYFSFIRITCSTIFSGSNIMPFTEAPEKIKKNRHETVKESGTRGSRLRHMFL